MRSFLRLLIPLLSLPWLFNACVDPYQPPEITTSYRYLVVDGVLNSGSGPSQIRLSRTQLLTDTAQPPAELHAQVSVEGDGVHYTFTEGENGLYTLPETVFPVGSSYRLHIRTQDGNEYVSDPTTIKATPPIERLSWRVENDGVQLLVSTQDPTNQTWYYRWTYEETWEFTSAFDSQVDYIDQQVVPRTENIYRCWQTQASNEIIVGSSTRLSQDVISDFPLRFLAGSSARLAKKYSILASQYALSKASYEYWELLKKNTERLGTLFDPQPSQLTGNIHCLTDAQQLAIGYFEAANVQQQRLFITQSELPPWQPITGYENCHRDTLELAAMHYQIPAVYEVVSYGIYLFKEYPRGSDVPILVPKEGVTVSSPECVDCRLRGTNIKPDFWGE